MNSLILFVPWVLATSAHAACQKVWGTGHTSLYNEMKLYYNEDGADQCWGDGGADGSAKCNSGFTLDWYGSHAGVAEPLPVYLCNAGGW
jgi:hypothetical protein